MFQNIKVDIIYYQTGTDFEMEFNLCGCCRMRLLTDKAEEPKSLIHLLARAVSRSRVIIACGSLFGDDGLIATVAAAIGKPLAAADNRAFNIRDEREIMIIGGSLPLVTADGTFGGCIIESGPQAIILLTESRSVRKTIMNTLIHPYVEDMSITPMSGSGSHATAVPSIPQESSPLPKPEADPAAEEPEQSDRSVLSEADAEEEVSAEEPEAPLPPVAETEEEKITKTEPESPSVPAAVTDGAYEDISSITAPEQEPVPQTPEGPHISLVYSDGNPSDQSDDKLYRDDYGMFTFSDEVQTPRSSAGKLRLSILILSVLLLIGIAVLAYLLIYLPMRDGVALTDYLREIFAVSGHIGGNQIL